MDEAERFPYVAQDPALGSASLVPMLPVTLAGPRTLPVSGLVDSGATVNVLPYTVGQQLGFAWDQQTTVVRLSGNLAAIEARVVLVTGTVGRFAPVKLAFAWAKSDAAPMLLGQVNFFLEFDVCFFRAQQFFEVRPKRSS